MAVCAGVRMGGAPLGFPVKPEKMALRQDAPFFPPMVMAPLIRIIAMVKDPYYQMDDHTCDITASIQRGLLTMAHIGCGSRHGIPNVAWQMETKIKTCGLPLLLNFEPPLVCLF